MSWQQYTDYLLQGNICEQAHIFEKTQFGVWASSDPTMATTYQLPYYQKEVPSEADPDKLETVNVYECLILVSALANKGVVSAEHKKTGIWINNEKYFTVRFDEELGTWYLKKNGGGACMAITNQCVVFGSFNANKKLSDGVSPQSASTTNKAVEELQRTLLQSGY